MTWRMKLCLGGVLLFSFLSLEARAAVVGAPMYFRPAPPRDPSGPTGWLCQDKPYLPCHYIYAPNSCFEWIKNPNVYGFCSFIDGYEEDWIRMWKESLWGTGGWSVAPRVGAGPSANGDGGTHWTLDVQVTQAAECLPAGTGCSAVPIGELACGTEARFADDQGEILSVSDGRFYRLAPEGQP
jgi:hypothetical protein